MWRENPKDQIWIRIQSQRWAQAWQMQNRIQIQIQTSLECNQA